jgi:hypothetical protein
MIGSTPKFSFWKPACICALSNGIPRRSFCVAVVVGTVLNLINQGDALFGAASINWAKLILTYCVPYLVCTYGAVASHVHRSQDNAVRERSA